MRLPKLAIPELPIMGRAMLAPTLSFIAATAIPALIAPAIILPATAFAQTVSCTACTHEVSYFKGKGGLIAKAAKNAEGETATEVTWVAQCGGVVRSGKLEANDDGIVSTLFDDDNNLACSTDDGRFRLGPVTDGGWFWITDDENSAVGNLVNKNVLGNAATTLANAGPGVETAAGRGVTFVKETATGRVGILPNVLPVAPVPPTRKCGFTGTPNPGTSTAGKTRIASNCKLGDGKAMIVLSGPVGVGGSTAPLPNNVIVRPYSGTVTVNIDTFMNGSGHYVTDPNGDPDLGWVGGNPLPSAFGRAWAVLPVPQGLVRLPTLSATRAPGSTRGGVIIPNSRGLAIGRAGSAGTYCGTAESPKNNPMKVLIRADNLMPTRVVPTVVTKSMRLPDGVTIALAAQTTLTVVCPSSPEAQALRRQGLMPESLFRTE